MPSKSIDQQRLMGVALSVKRGKKSLSGLPKGLQTKIKPLLQMSDKQISDFAKIKLKELIASLIQEIILEDETSTNVEKKEIEIPDFEKYLKLPQNIGISFTQKEKDSTNIPNLKPAFSKSIFEIRYRSTEDVVDDGKFIKTNKTTVVKKIRIGNNIAYKTFTLVEPSQLQQKQPSVDSTGKTEPIKPETKKVIEITSNSFTEVQGNPELFVKFLKDVNEDIGL